MRFRQVHLDFHTSGIIDNIGSEFEARQFQKNLKNGHVNSINLFAKCHHGFSYYPSKVNEVHPGLKFDLLTSMIDAAKEIDVDVQIYVSAGIDEKYAKAHPEWLIRDQNKNTRWTPNFQEPGFHELCLNTPYLSELLKQIEEILYLYKPKGLWLDIVGVRPCYCESCKFNAQKMGIDENNPNEMRQLWEATYKNYIDKVADLIHMISHHTEVFHNSGHFVRGRSDLWSVNSHYELESLPTGGWGYDHFPISARYIQQFGVEFLGMTGKFHTSWGEFGGFKHYNALRYEMAINLMNGAKCSIGDQLHPNGKMDEATYELIGEAYREVEKKEAWCEDVSSIADIGILSAESIEDTSILDDFNNQSDSGVVRMLLEEHYLFDLIDAQSNFSKYKLIILPDTIKLNKKLAARLQRFIDNGGKIIASGVSGFDLESHDFLSDLKVKYIKENDYVPAYINPEFKLKSISKSSYVIYEDSFIIAAHKSSIVGSIEKPYENRKVNSFFSHQHFPNSNIQISPGIVLNENTAYLGWNIFKEYAWIGSYIHREIIAYIIDRLLKGEKTVHTSLPSQGNISLMHQKREKRFILHIVYGSPITRGKDMRIIEDIPPIYDIEINLNIKMEVNKIYLAPSNNPIEYSRTHNKLNFIVPKIECHQMVVIDYD